MGQQEHVVINEKKIIIERLDGPSISRWRIGHRAMQMLTFLRGTEEFYKNELQLPAHKPWMYEPGNPRQVIHRGHLMRQTRALYGRNVEDRSDFFGAYLADKRGRPGKAPEALIGGLVLSKEGVAPCTAAEHTPTKLELLYVTPPEYRGKGLGKLLLRHGMAQVHPQDPVFLEVFESNVNARQTFENLGFSYNDRMRKSDIYDDLLLGMQILAVALQGRLGLYDSQE